MTGTTAPTGPSGPTGDELIALYRLAAAFCPDPGRAADLVIGASAGPYRHPPAGQKAWQKALLAVYVARRAGWAAPSTEPMTSRAAGPPSPVSPISEGADARDPVPALAALPQSTREVAVVRFYLDRPISAVSNLLHRSGLGVRRSLRAAHRAMAETTGGPTDLAGLRALLHDQVDALTPPAELNERVADARNTAMAASDRPRRRARLVVGPVIVVLVGGAAVAIAATTGGPTGPHTTTLPVLTSRSAVPPTQRVVTAPALVPTSGARTTRTGSSTASTSPTALATAATTHSAGVTRPRPTTSSSSPVVHPVQDPFRKTPACGATLPASALGITLHAKFETRPGPSLLATTTVRDAGRADIVLAHPRWLVVLLRNDRIVAEPRSGWATSPRLGVPARGAASAVRQDFTDLATCPSRSSATGRTTSRLPAGNYQVVVIADGGTVWATAEPATVLLLP